MSNPASANESGDRSISRLEAALAAEEVGLRSRGRAADAEVLARAREGDVAVSEAKAAEERLAAAGEQMALALLRRRRVEIDEKAAADWLSRPTGDPAVLLPLAKRLKDAKRFGLARRLLKLARQDLRRASYPDIWLEIHQQSALCTYKDPDLPLEWRLNRALEILEEVEATGETRNPETLGLAGAIYKRKWEVDGRRANLERSLFFYLRGYARSAPPEARGDVIGYLEAQPEAVFRAESDQGYTGINAAFVLDLLAALEEEEAGRAGLPSAAAENRRRAARLIRGEITRSVPALRGKEGFEWLARKWWFYSTVGEAFFGLGPAKESHYAEAVAWLVDEPRRAGLMRPWESGVGFPVPEWEYESTARQLARLARVQGCAGESEEAFVESAAGRALDQVLGRDGRAVRTAFQGKFGLGLSGGGFRAALFHIGVLARLAELDVLRHVEVISCVSGGSIIGAHYYLELRRLLQTKADDDIKPADYVELVRRVEEKFLEGVQRNVRTRVLAEWTTNLRMAFPPGYSRTRRVGELYEREIYSRVEDGEGLATGPAWLPDWLARRLGCRRDVRWLNELLIRPRLPDGTRHEEFNPRDHNWRRTHKVPVLVLNATSLNTGHNWQFTATYMGEPPTPIDPEIDANYRLRRMYYVDAPARYRRIRLGDAVAASSCVPGLFEPLVLDGLYEGRSVRLVDGGVCDNQGVGSLLEQDCTVLLVSDACGQMGAEDQPSGGTVGVPLRSNSILQARVREALYHDVAARRRAEVLRGLMFVHLNQGISGGEVPWLSCPSYLRESEFESARNRTSDATRYDVCVEMQRRLAAIRTDLDSFHDVEAFALMASGYQMTRHCFAGPDASIRGFADVEPSGQWRFLPLVEALKPRPADPALATLRPWLAKLLEVSGGAAFKVWKLSPVLKILKWVLVIGVLGGVVGLFARHWGDPILAPSTAARFTYRALAGFLGFAVLGWIAGWALRRLFGPLLGEQFLRVVRWRETLRSTLVGLGMATVGFLVARLHLHVFDRWYLKLGSRRAFESRRASS